MASDLSFLNFVVESLSTQNENQLEETKLSVLSILENGEEKFLSLVQGLGTLLANANDGERKTGTNFLVSVLAELKKDFLNEKEVEHLVTFFTDRLKDVSHIIPIIIQGLLYLTKFENLPPGAGPKILLCLFHSIHIPTQLQPERYNCYSIVGNLINNPKQLQELQSQPLAQQSEIVLGFLQACDGERDPRCLLLSFHIGRGLALNFPLGAMAEDFFESFSCYFPVDFKPPDHDERGITREDLSLALRNCLASSPMFAEFLFPFVLDKLDSSLVQCKLDSLDLLREAFKIYHSDNIDPFLLQIWNKLRSEILINDSKEVEDASLETLACLIRVLHGNSLSMFISKVWKECEALLDTSVDGLKIIIAVAKASDESGFSIITLGLPSLMSKVDPSSSGVTEARKIGALSTILSFLNMDNNSKLSPVWEENGTNLIASFFALWHCSGETKILSMRGLTLSLQKCKSCWTEKDSDLLTRHLWLWTKELQGESQELLIDTWQELALELAKHDSTFISDKLLPEWLDNLKNSINVDKSIGLLASVSRVSDLRDEIINFISNEINLNTRNVNYFKCLLRVSTVNSGELNQDFGNSLYSTCVLNLVKNSISTILNEALENEELKEIRLILECLTPTLNKENGADLGTRILILFTETPANFTTLSPEKQLTLSQLSLSVISHLSKEGLNVIPSNQLCSLATNLIKNLNEVNEQLGLIYSEILACILNKRDQIDELLNTIEEIASKSELTGNIVTLWVWLCKAIVLRGYNYPTATEKLMEFLSDEKVGSLAAESFHVILAEAPRVISKSSKANIKLFYSQRFFTMTKERLLKNYHEVTNGDLKNNYLRALSHQLKFLPTAILRKELPPLLPMLIKSLTIENNDLLVSILGSLKELLNTDVNLAKDHASNLVNRLTILSTNHPSMMGRMLALDCLHSLAFLPEDEILILMPDVLEKIRPCLDDKKRLVRQQAATTIAKWYLIGKTKD